jgi:hypothetical protein
MVDIYLSSRAEVASVILMMTLCLEQETTIKAAINLGRPEARMDVEVNDYPTPGANDDHDPGHGRA